MFLNYFTVYLSFKYLTVKAFDGFLCVLIHYIIVLTEIEHILFLLLFGYPNIMILIAFKEKKGEFGSLYFAKVIGYGVFQNLDICGGYCLKI